MRDMTDHEFYDALKRRGYKIVLLWITRPADSSLSVGLVAKKRRGQWGINKRASLAKAIRLFKEHDRNKAKRAA